MSYLESDGKLVWHSDRDTQWLSDPVRRAAEKLADRVETYLYDSASGVYLVPEFLSWAVAQFDVEKTGSGNYAQENAEFDREAWLGGPSHEQHALAGNPEMVKNIVARAPKHALQAENVNTEPAASKAEAKKGGKS